MWLALLMTIVIYFKGGSIFSMKLIYPTLKFVKWQQKCGLGYFIVIC